VFREEGPAFLVAHPELGDGFGDGEQVAHAEGPIGPALGGEEVADRKEDVEEGLRRDVGGEGGAVAGGAVAHPGHYPDRVVRDRIGDGQPAGHVALEPPPSLRGREPGVNRRVGVTSPAFAPGGFA
jgi:hypothetical protein